MLHQYYIGLMSGTSLDGVDGALMSSSLGDETLRAVAFSYVQFDSALRSDLLSLQTPANNEIHLEAMTANRLVSLYAECVANLLQEAKLTADDITLIGVHGQTIRHRPEHGYTRQINNPALLAELTGIDVVADFRSRDVAAGGQGAPLVPAYHDAMFTKTGEPRVVLNIGGIANISILNGQRQAVSGSATVMGFDTGPGNVLLDAWVHRHREKPYDRDGEWAAGGKVLIDLLASLRSEPYFGMQPPKSTGRDLFNMSWLERYLNEFLSASPVSIQTTLAALTATTIADAINTYASNTQSVYVCGGGAYNKCLMKMIQGELQLLGSSALVMSTDVLGILPSHVEANAFAWLARCFDRRQPGNLPNVTGARGPRILGALYPAK